MRPDSEKNGSGEAGVIHWSKIRGPLHFVVIPRAWILSGRSSSRLLAGLPPEGMLLVEIVDSSREPVIEIAQGVVGLQDSRLFRRP